MSDAPRAPNRLSLETSPYLLQHATNPVDWYPWGPEALDRARAEDRPILLSIGYAACHWCHVMERESFEDEAIAQLMNREFVCIKVDREERPDLDDLYMAATVAMTGHGGWPMTVFLTPDQRPFFAGTYFPPKDVSGRPGLPTVLARISELWRSDRESLLEQATELTEHLAARSEPAPEAHIPSEAADRAATELARAFDEEHGGFGRAPKFPPSGALSLLLRLHARKGDPALLRMVTRTLDAMKNGGIYDQLGGGFARYSVDDQWLAPHFEKMLYDNAQLARSYLEGWQVTGDPEYRRIATETLDYVMRELQAPEGGYHSATDADSEGVEGKFFVWSPDQVEEILGRPDTEAFCAYYDVTPEGNWEGVSILRTPRALGAVAAELGTTEDALATTLAAARRRLYAARLGRVPPLTDDKVLASWNGLMISAMAEGARVFGDARYRESAERAAEFVLGVLSRPDGGLYRTARGARAHLPGYLEDYAFVADALVDLYESGGSERYLKEALRLAERLVADFGDPEGGAFHQTAHQHEALIARLREGHDGALPNANAVAARALARLGAHFDRKELRDRAAAALLAHGQALQRAPRAFVTSLGVLDFLLEGPVELALVGPRDSAETRALAAAVARRYLPNRIVAHLADGDRTELPLLAAKSARGGPPALHVCRGFTCQAPVTDPRAVDAALHEATTALSRARSRVLGRTALPGRATPEATRQRCEELARSAGEHATIALGSTGLTVSRLGFGCYRVDARAEPHREALTHALTRGVNLIDTSTNYADGWSERLVGEVLRDLHQQGTLRRESVVVVSKVGYAQGENLALARERGALGRPFPEMVEYGEELWHCIHPEWIEDQLGRSLERLRLETLDVLLLHNPEYFLGHAAAKGEDPEAAHREFYRRVTEAFRHLEAEVKRGRIGCYGVSSNTLGEADGPETTRLARLLDAAREAGGAAHHFRVVQLPLNLLEAGGALRPGTGEGADETLLTAASRHGLAVLANRPLNAILERGLLRLADPPELPGGASFPEALAALRELEREFGKSFAPSLTVPEGSQVRADQLLRWADQLGALGADLQSYEQWRDIETRAVAPRLLHVLTALDRAFTGREAPRWVAFRERYAGAMDDLLRSLRRRGADRSRRRSRALALALDPALAAERRAEPLSRKALFALTSEPGVTAVLVGMREVRYVDDALPVLGWAPTDAVSRLLEAASRAELG